MQIILQEKDPAVGINGYKGVGSEWLLPKMNPCYVLEESRIWRGRKGNRPTGACLLYYLSFFSSISFLPFFFFFYSVFSFYSVNTLFFDPFFKARQGPFYNACRGQCFTTLPLNRLCLVWAYLPTTKSVWHSPLPDKGRFVSFLSPP